MSFRRGSGRAASAACSALLLAALAPILSPPPAGAQSTDSPAESPDARTPSGVFSDVVRVDVINVDVVVTDRSGQSVSGLGREDFEIRVDGKPVEISNFYAEAAGPAAGLEPLPALEETAHDERDSSFRSVEEAQAGVARRTHVVLLVDHTRLRPANRKRAFNALREAVDSLGEDDLVSVVGVEGRLVFYSDFLFDREAVDQTLDEVARVSIQTDVNEMERRQVFDELARGQTGGILAQTSLADSNLIMTRIRAYAAQEHDRGLRSLQLIETVASTLSGVPGRKTLIYLGEGIPTRPGEGMYVEWRNRFSGPERGLPHQNYNSDYIREVGRYELTEPMRQLATSVNRAGVTLYSIDADGNHGGEIRSALTEQGAWSESVSAIDENYREPLEYASKATGGRLLLSSGNLGEQLVDLVGGFRTFYSLGFSPPAEWEPGSDHDLKVDVKGKGYRVSHREMIRLPKPDEREAGATVAALMYQTVDNPLGIRAHPGLAVPREDGTAALPVSVEIPIRKLGFLPQDSVHAGSLTFYVSVRDEDGNPGKVQKVPFHLNIPEDKLEEAKANAAHYPLPVVLRKGDRQVAIGIRDNVSGLFSAVRLDVSELSRF